MHIATPITEEIQQIQVTLVSAFPFTSIVITIVKGTFSAVITPKIDKSRSCELTAAKPVVAPANKNRTMNMFLSDSDSGHQIFSVTTRLS
jgi:hypothetical protein